MEKESAPECKKEEEEVSEVNNGGSSLNTSS